MSKQLDITKLSLEDQRKLAAQLAEVNKARQEKYTKGALMIDDMSVNKGGGIVLRFKGSRFPVNLWPSQFEQIIKNKKIIEKFIAEHGLVSDD